eukprot:6188474-Pleurochrysis_carterae.AAC.1
MACAVPLNHPLHLTRAAHAATTRNTRACCGIACRRRACCRTRPNSRVEPGSLAALLWLAGNAVAAQRGAACAEERRRSSSDASKDHVRGCARGYVAVRTRVRGRVVVRMRARVVVRVLGSVRMRVGELVGSAWGCECAKQCARAGVGLRSRVEAKAHWYTH